MRWAGETVQNKAWYNTEEYSHPWESVKKFDHEAWESSGEAIKKTRLE